MGCGASGSKKKAEEAVKENTEELVQPFDGASTGNTNVGGAWASKTDKAADNGMAFQIMNNPATKTKATTENGKASPAPGDTGLLLTDADDDDLGDVEVIAEGKVGQANFAGNKRPPAANGQDPDDENDSDAANAAEAAAAAEKAKAISARQREEAAKLAEQRKKFDPNRYQREMNAGLAGGSGNGVAPSGNVNAGSGHSPDGDAYERAMVMGLNLTKVQQQAPIADEGLPGAINDTPRDDQPKTGKKKQNQHDRFDDDDLRLMNEILDSVDY